MTDDQIYNKVTGEIDQYYAKSSTSLQFSHPRANVVSVRTFDAQMNVLEWRFQFGVDVQIIRSTIPAAETTDDTSSWFDSSFSHSNFLSWDTWDIKSTGWVQKTQDYLTNLENEVDAATNRRLKLQQVIPGKGTPNQPPANDQPQPASEAGTTSPAQATTENIKK